MNNTNINININNEISFFNESKNNITEKKESKEEIPDNYPLFSPIHYLNHNNSFEIENDLKIGDLVEARKKGKLKLSFGRIINIDNRGYFY